MQKNEPPCFLRLSLSLSDFAAWWLTVIVHVLATMHCCRMLNATSVDVPQTQLQKHLCHALRKSILYNNIEDCCELAILH